LNLFSDILFSFKKLCPVCRQGKLFSEPMVIAEKCNHCNDKLRDHDMGDAAAVFLIFILGATLVPMAWIIELNFEPPLWVHVVWCGIVGLAMIFVLLPAVKAYLMLLEYRHRPKETKKTRRTKKSVKKK